MRNRKFKFSTATAIVLAIIVIAILAAYIILILREGDVQVEKLSSLIGTAKHFATLALFSLGIYNIHNVAHFAFEKKKKEKNE